MAVTGGEASPCGKDAATRCSTAAARPRRRARSFTLLELLIVVVVLGVLGAVVVPRFSESTDKVKVRLCRQTVKTIHTQVERWKFSKGTWPQDDLSDIGADPAYFPDGVPRCPVDGSAYVLDPTTHRVAGHDHAAAALGDSN